MEHTILETFPTVLHQQRFCTLKSNVNTGRDLHPRFSKVKFEIQTATKH